MGSLVDASYELLDPTPDVHALFVAFDARFFGGKLAACEVKWSPRMTTCAGICSYEVRSGLCSIRLSTPLLKLRPRKDLVETLLHEMIHAFLFVTVRDQDRDGHGPRFQEHMHRINAAAGTHITIYHTFHAEVAQYKTHHWRCTGPCRERRPYFGWVKRASNRAPSKNDPWWAEHERSCGGKYVKVAEPAEYTEKRAAAEKRKEDKENGGGGGKKKPPAAIGDGKPVGAADAKQPRIDAVFGGGGGARLGGDTATGSIAASAAAAAANRAAGGGDGRPLGGGGATTGRSRLLDLFEKKEGSGGQRGTTVPAMMNRGLTGGFERGLTGGSKASGGSKAFPKEIEVIELEMSPLQLKRAMHGGLCGGGDVYDDYDSNGAFLCMGQEDFMDVGDEEEGSEEGASPQPPSNGNPASKSSPSLRLETISTQQDLIERQQQENRAAAASLAAYDDEVPSSPAAAAAATLSSADRRRMAELEENVQLLKAQLESCQEEMSRAIREQAMCQLQSLAEQEEELKKKLADAESELVAWGMHCKGDGEEKPAMIDDEEPRDVMGRLWEGGKRLVNGVVNVARGAMLDSSGESGKSAERERAGAEEEEEEGGGVSRRAAARKGRVPAKKSVYEIDDDSEDDVPKRGRRKKNEDDDYVPAEVKRNAAASAAEQRLAMGRSRRGGPLAAAAAATADRQQRQQQPQKQKSPPVVKRRKRSTITTSDDYEDTDDEGEAAAAAAAAAAAHPEQVYEQVAIVRRVTPLLDMNPLDFIFGPSSLRPAAAPDRLQVIGMSRRAVPRVPPHYQRESDQWHEQERLRKRTAAVFIDAAEAANPQKAQVPPAAAAADVKEEEEEPKEAAAPAAAVKESEQKKEAEAVVEAKIEDKAKDDAGTRYVKMEEPEQAEEGEAAATPAAEKQKPKKKKATAAAVAAKKAEEEEEDDRAAEASLAAAIEVICKEEEQEVKSSSAIAATTGDAAAAAMDEGEGQPVQPKEGKEEHMEVETSRAAQEEEEAGITALTSDVSLLDPTEMSMEL